MFLVSCFLFSFLFSLLRDHRLAPPLEHALSRIARITLFQRSLHRMQTKPGYTHSRNTPDFNPARRTRHDKRIYRVRSFTVEKTVTRSTRHGAATTSLCFKGVSFQIGWVLLGDPIRTRQTQVSLSLSHTHAHTQGFRVATWSFDTFLVTSVLNLVLSLLHCLYIHHRCMARCSARALIPPPFYSDTDRHRPNIQHLFFSVQHESLAVCRMSCSC